MRRHETWIAVLALGLASALVMPAPAAWARSKSSKSGSTKSSHSAAKAAPSQGPVDLNTASQAQLEALPGVGAATAKKIIAGRPYSSVGDLKRAGIAAGTIRTVSSQVTVSGAPAASMPRASRASTPASNAMTSGSSPRAGAATAAHAGGPVDLNSASEAQLEALPGVGPATAKKIIADRPYSNVADLQRAGVPKHTVDQISGMVTAGAAPGAKRGWLNWNKGAAAPAAAPSASPEATPPSPAVTARPAPAAHSTPAEEVAAPPSGSGMVWVNLSSGVYHHEGDRWYGKTKSGKYMTEADAMKAGYRSSKTEKSTGN